MLPPSGYQKGFSGIDGWRPGVPDRLPFMTCVWQSGIQKCFKLESKTSQIMTIQ
ncbi:hypothetical protein Bphyt_1457 [Paraburkholderia phytofirmans PsJN]|uniref:Uncharacterized protein n=1 Tax=Paraburkholderia phytofirmans (strain DSM 17436 / LMG 22146 / PsJN) TaxID=398527 RepID=B2T2R1_PARPJ|nr:hypothetical protein Bphyt_1457 [Paraburkholderia phytofirmans PsJN]